MIAFLTVPLGIGVLALQGALFLRLIEGEHPVLHPMERLCGGLFVGQAWSAYILFWAALIGLPLVPLFVIGFHCVFLAILLAFFWRRTGSLRTIFENDSPSVPCTDREALVQGLEGRPAAAVPPALPRWLRTIGILLIAFLAVKLALATSDLLFTPTFFNDAYANWNMRAKVFFTHQNLLLDRDLSDPFFFGGRVPSYPLTVYFTKILLVSLVGVWSDAAANSIHMAWFLATLGILWTALRRELNSLFAWAGVIVLAGMPLVYVHSFSAYADLVFAGHLLFSLLCFYRWVHASQDARQTWLRILGVSLGSMLFLKNEATMIMLPVFGVLGVLVLLMEWRSRKQSFDFAPSFAFGYGRARQGKKAENRDQKSDIRSILFAVGAVLMVLVPWSVFKWFHHLDFGNAHEVSSMVLSPHAGVPAAIWDAITYTGSFLIFIPIFLYLLVRTISFWTRHAIGILVLFLLIVFMGEFGIFYLTELAGEALRHTGFSRGVLQLMPGAVFVAMMLIQWILREDAEMPD